MFKLKIPGFGDLRIRYIVLDLNGTIAVDGRIDEEFVYLARTVKQIYSIKYVILTAGTRTIPQNAINDLNAEIFVISGDEAKAKKLKVIELGATEVCAVGNGANDELMLKVARLGICVVGEEGASPKALVSSDIVVKDIKDAMKLFLHPKRLLATLRF